MGKKKIYLVWIILVLLAMIMGSYAYFSWRTSESRLALTVGDINNIQVTLKPYRINAEMVPVSTYESESYVNVDVVNSSNKSKGFELYYSVNTIDQELRSNDFKYTITKSIDGGNTYSEVKTGNFSEAVDNTNIIIYNATVSSNTTEKYRVYVWLSNNGDQSNVSGASFNAELRAEFDSSSNIVVDVPDGLIPVVFDTSNGTVVKTVSSTDASWYDYNSQEWANAVLVKESGIQTRTYYKNNPGVSIDESDILAYYVWIPRYSYMIWTTGTSDSGQEQTIEIKFESTDIISTGTQVGEYITHPAFWWDNNSNGVRDSGEELSGIWVGKFETGGMATAPLIKPNISSLRSQTVSKQFTIAQIFGTSTYGITSNIDAHMMKNSEWGAVAYLSHSKYGVNREIYINNSSGFYTGRSGGNVGGSTAINTVYTSQTSTTQYKTYGFYTWDGYLLEYDTNTKSSTHDISKVASTTGNITGVYDMSGGAREYVMGYYSPASTTWGATSSANKAGFTSQPDSKYYDNYTTTSALTACNGGICYGHGLSETNAWHIDNALFVDGIDPWFTRGGRHIDRSNAGAFYFKNVNGGPSTVAAARSVIVYDPTT